ncbi:MAG: hypothetical protein BM563_08040 [Bacteroidetes bacterium MedPE-SWsnd-G1]|nr:MAG: hypothetical protein BM563_08040 [Bacteroidetes bacterium MedPE-SWsnd-G1]
MKISNGILLVFFAGLLITACKKEKKSQEHTTEEHIEVVEDHSDNSETHSNSESKATKEHSQPKTNNSNEHAESDEEHKNSEVHKVEEIESESAEISTIDTEEKEPRLSVKTVEKPPVYQDCKGNNDQLMECFNKKIVEFVDKHYNPIVSAEDGITDDNYRVVVQFDVNTFGEIVDVHAQGPNKETSDEAVRVIKLLPKMEPATHNGKPVRVVYNVPIKLKVRT